MKPEFNINETVFFLDPERDRIHNVLDVSMGNIIGMKLENLGGGYASVIYTVKITHAIFHKEKRRWETTIHEMSEGSIERDLNALKVKLGITVEL